MSNAPKRLRDFFWNQDLIRDSRGWAKREAEKVVADCPPAWLLEKVVIDDEFMRLASENIKKKVETIKTEKNVVWVNLEDLTITIPIQGEE